VTISDGEILLRLAVALLLCGALGLERETRAEVAGLRTHMLVGLGAAVFTLLSAHAVSDAESDRVDPTRIAAQIVTGIGFLGAGAIVREGFSVRGVTTAAALWISAAVGMAAGFGFYFGAVAATVVALIALVVFRQLRPLIARHGTDSVVLRVELRPGAPSRDVLGMLAAHGVLVTEMQTRIADRVQVAELALRVPAAVDFDPLIRELGELPAVEGLTATGLRLAAPVPR
jgi:putative Mg2+ transporter-C (MgtC) family protein